MLGYSIIGDIAELDNVEAFSFAIAVGDNAVRERIYKELTANTENLHFPAIVHSSAVVSYFCDIKDGAVVMPKAVIGPNSKVGKFCLINTQASIEHDCVMFDYSSLAPGNAKVECKNTTVKIIYFIYLPLFSLIFLELQAY